MKSTFLDGYRANFETLSRAFEGNDVALMECQDRKTGEKVAVIAAVNVVTDEEGKREYEFVPFARFFNGNPYEELNPPAPDGGFAQG